MTSPQACIPTLLQGFAVEIEKVHLQPRWPYLGDSQSESDHKIALEPTELVWNLGSLCP